MSEETIANLSRGYEALNRRDWDAVFRDARPDFELTTPPGPHAGTYRGREECQGYLEGWITAFEAWTVEPEELFESGDHVVVVRRGYQALAEHGIPDFEFLDPEIEWRGPREFPDLAEPHYGHEGVARYFAKLNEAFDDYRVVPEEFIDAGGDQVLVFSREGGRGKGSG